MKPESTRAALLIPRLTADADANLTTIERMATDAVSAGANLLLLPEAALTGLINNDDPVHDLPLGQTVPGPATDRLGAFCARYGVWLGLGMLERQERRLYNSAVLLKPDGSIGLVYRRNQPQWHGTKADPATYRQGTELPVASTPFGTVGFLLCGDLFDDDIVARFRGLGVDWMLFPFARCFADGTADQARWETEELPQYAQRVKMAQTPALMVNYFADASLGDDNSFGGGCAISATGEIVASHHLGGEGIMIVDIDTVSHCRHNMTR